MKNSLYNIFSDFLFGKKVEKEEPIKYRIVKEEWKNGNVSYFIEHYTTFYGDEPFWHCLNFMSNRNHFKTHEEASAFLKDYLTPPEKPVQTVVEEI